MACTHVGAEFIPKFFQKALDGHGSRIAQRANGAEIYVIGHFAQQFHILFRGMATFNFVQNFFRPVSSFAAGGTLTAGFMAVKVQQIQQRIYHTGVFVHDNGAGRPQHGADGRQGVKIHRHINFVRP